MEKYILKLKKKKKSFAIYTYDKEAEKEEKIFEYTNEPIKETRTCKDCSNCKRRSLSEEEIIERVRKLGTTQ